MTCPAAASCARPTARSRGNAFYTFEGDFIAYDDADLPQLYGQLGPAVIGVVLRPRVGSTIQRRIGYRDADHLHGAAGRLCRPRGSPTSPREKTVLPFADADLKNAINGMIRYGTSRTPVPRRSGPRHRLRPRRRVPGRLHQRCDAVA